MLINLRNALMTGKRLPFDAEVEFLESTGEQYINTGVLASAALNDAQIDITYSSSSTSGDLYIFGGGATFNTAIQCVINSSSNYLQPSWGQSLAIADGYAANAVATLRMTYNDYALTFGTTTRTGAFTATSRTFDDRAIYLFRGNRTSGGINTKPVRIYAFKISRNGIPILDLIPVRKGTTGELYDRVSGKFAERHGDFVLGADVVPVEYLQSSGTQWIDTGVVPAANDTFTVETRKNNASQDNASFGLAGCVYCFSNGGSLTGNGTFWGHPAVGLGGTAGVNPLGDTNWHTIVASPTSVTVDGLPLGNRAADAQSPLSTVKLFARGTNSASGGVAKRYNGMISHAFINRGSSDLRKFYAVRVGTEGAMMDVLTRRIYRNAGTGAFTYGNDLKYPIPAE